MLDLIVSSYMVPFFGLLFLLALNKINPIFDKKQNIIFTCAVSINICLIIATALDYVFASSQGTWMLRRITSFLNFSCSPLVPILLLNIFVGKKQRWYLYAPFVMNAILCVISVFYNLVFFIGENNSYDRGILFFVPFITTIFYIALLMKKPMNYHRQSKKNERMFLIFIITLLGLAMIIEIKFRMHFLVWGCSALSLILYYQLLNIHNFIIDPLTGAYNRLMYNSALNEIKNNVNCSIAILDINNFKNVNDEFGHDAGDAFLIDFTLRVNEHMDTVATLYRIGGDEFVLISKNENMVAFEQKLRKTYEDLANEGMSFAYGLINYKIEDDINEVLRRVDHNMYESKRLSKRNKK